MSKTIAWHWTNGRLRDGRPQPPVGEWLVHEGKIEMCQSGLHASKRVTDALDYAPGSVICRVECHKDIQHHSDKFVCRERKILWTYDAEKELLEYARRCAWRVIHLWDAPDVVRRYLKTGDESLRNAAWASARNAAWASARDAAEASAGAAALAAAVDAARDASRASAWASAEASAWASARAAAKYAAKYAAWDAAKYAAKYAAWDAARAVQNRILTGLLVAGAKKRGLI